MNIGIVGLGLIGGSMAKVLSQTHRIFAAELREDVLKDAAERGIITAILDKNNMADCQCILLALTPGALVEYVGENAEHFAKDTVVMDLCGVKRAIVAGIAPLLKERGIAYLGAHPMAGLAKVGWEFSKGSLFQNASMILAPEEDTPPAALRLGEQIAADAGFNRVVYSTPETHDRIIAYTSQLAHVLSNAYVKSPQALEHQGYSAGSFRDLTRVAWLDEDMWTELFMANADYLGAEIEGLIGQLSAYARALESGDRGALNRLLREGRIRKESLGE